MGICNNKTRTMKDIRDRRYYGYDMRPPHLQKDGYYLRKKKDFRPPPPSSNNNNDFTNKRYLMTNTDFGVFGDHESQPYRQYLIDKNLQSNNEKITDLISELQGDQNAEFSITHSGIPGQALQALIDLADQQHQKMLEGTQNSKQKIDDLKIKLSREQLVGLIGKGSCRKLQGMFVDQYCEIILRRCQAHGMLINFHTDFAIKTLQLSLNSDSQYEGGRLIYATKGELVCPKRNGGTVTIHTNRIVHGVSLLESGVRYGLFLLKKQKF